MNSKRIRLKNGFWLGFSSWKMVFYSDINLDLTHVKESSFLLMAGLNIGYGF